MTITLYHRHFNVNPLPPHSFLVNHSYTVIKVSLAIVGFSLKIANIVCDIKNYFQSIYFKTLQNKNSRILYVSTSFTIDTHLFSVQPFSTYYLDCRLQRVSKDQARIRVQRITYD